MSQQAKLYKKICEANISLENIADRMNLSVVQLEEKIDDMDLLATEMQQLTDILNIQDPYNFFY